MQAHMTRKSDLSEVVRHYKYGQGKLWDEAFAHTDQLLSLGMVASTESQSEKPLSAKEIQTTPEKTKTEAERPPLDQKKRQK